MQAELCEHKSWKVEKAYADSAKRHISCVDCGFLELIVDEAVTLAQVETEIVKLSTSKVETPKKEENFDFSQISFGGSVLTREGMLVLKE